MNYRHSFHAGNFADVLKHIVLVAALGAMQKKDAGLFVLDAFAGCGVYDLHSEQAARSPEFLEGINKIWDAKAALPAAIKNYLNVLDEATEGNERFYAGSPFFVTQMLRDQDRAVLNELHPLEKLELDKNLSELQSRNGKRRVKTTQIDGYLAIKANLPPPERRGLIIIDPPFEIAGEFERMIEALQQGLKRFATGVFMLWHADKDENAVRKYRQAIKSIGKEALIIDLRIAKEDGTTGLKANGLTIINPPFGLEAQIEATKSVICNLLGKDESAKMVIKLLNS